MIGETVSHYRITERLGGGGMGLVYRAQDTRLDRTVALKFLPMEWSQEPLLRERFSREARAASALDHPHICTIYDVGETAAGQLFIAMAYCPGDTLKQRIQRGPMPVDEAVAIAIQIAEALGSAHEAGIVHRDIKPANILITGDDQVKVVDFGLAKLAGEAAVTREGSVVGTPAYMSPEQATGDEIDGRSDLWALGAVLYEMLTGRRAFSADHEQAILLAIISADPTPVESLRSDIPAEIGRIVRRCLKREPTKRYQSAEELVRDLKRFRGDPTAADLATQTLPSAPRVRRRGLVIHRLLPISAAVIIVALVATLSPLFEDSPSRHLLVLPFDCRSQEDDAIHLCEGLLDTVTAKLTELKRFRSSLSVVPASEVRAQKIGSAEDAHRVFGVEIVLTGSVQRDGDTLRIALQLVDANLRRQLRARTITTERTADFVLQDRVVSVVEEMLDVELGAAERHALRVGGTSSAEAASLFLEARGRSSDEPSENELNQAMALYRQALELDPEFAEAMVFLAHACHERYGLSEDPIWLEHGANYARRALDVAPELPDAHLAAGVFALDAAAYPAAIEHLQQAITLDPLNLRAYAFLADAYRASGEPEQAEEALDRAVRTGADDWGTSLELGRLAFERGDWERAALHFRRVIELLPDSSIGYTSLGGCFLYSGDPEAARENLERAVEIGPTYWALSNLATLEYYQQHCDRAAELYRRALEIDDGDYQIWNNLGEASRCADNPQQALAAYRKAEELAAAELERNPNDARRLIDFASFKVQLGDQAAAREILGKVLALGVSDPSPMFDLAALYEELGERHDALVWLERCLEQGFPLELIRSYDGFATLRNDPRFQFLETKFSTTAGSNPEGRH